MKRGDEEVSGPEAARLYDRRRAELREQQRMIQTARDIVRSPSAHTELSVSLAEALLRKDVGVEPLPGLTAAVVSIPPFALGSSRLPGLAKANEEAGELVQVIGKVLALGHAGRHWDGTHLGVRLREEVADLRAALHVLCQLNPELDDTARLKTKRELLLQWHHEGLLDEEVPR